MADQLIQEIISEQAFKEVERLQEIMAATLKTFEDSAVSVKEFDAALRSANSIPELNKAIADNVKLEKEMIRQEQELEKLNKQKAITEQTLEKLKQSQMKTESDSIKLQQLKNKESEKSAKQARDEADAYVQLKKEYNAVAAEAKRLSVEYGASNEKAAEATARAKALHDQLLAVESAVGQSQRNVGNYPESAKIIVEAMERARKKVVEVGKAMGPVSPEAQAARKEFDALDRITQNPRFLNIAAQVGDTNKELRFFTQELNTLEDAGLKNSDVYRDVQHRLAQLTDQIGDTRAEIKAMASDTHAIDLFSESISFLASTFEAVAGAEALAGKGSESIERTTKNLIAIQNVANGVREISKQITEKGTAANKVYNYVLEQGTILFGKGSTAAQRFGAALKGIVILAVIGLIFKLVESIDILGDSQKKTAERAKAMDEAFSNLNDTLQKQIDILSEGSRADILLLKNELAVAEARGANATQLFLLKKKLAEEEKKLADDQLQAQITRAEGEDIAYTQSLKGLDAIAAATEEYARLRDQELEYLKQQELKKANILRLGGDEEVKKVDAEIDRTKQSIQTYEKIYSDYTNAGVKAFETQQKLDELNAAEQRRRIENAVEVAAKLKKLQDDTRTSLFGSRQKELENQISYQERIIGNDKYSYEERFAATQSFYDLSFKLSQQQRAFEIKDAQRQTEAEIIETRRVGKEKGYTEKQISDQVAAIKANSLAKQKEIETKYTAEVIGLEKQSEDQRKSLREKAEEDASAHRESIHETEMQDIQNQYDQDILALDRKFEKGKISEEKYNRRRLLLQVNLQAALLQSDINFTKQTIELAEARARASGKQEDLDAVAAAKKKLVALEIQLQQTVAEFTKKKNKETLEDIERTLNKVADIGSKLTDIIGGFISAGADREKNKIQGQIDAIDKLKEKRIEEVQSSIGSEQEKADKIKIIEAKAAADKEALQRRERQAEERRARFDKAANIARIIVETALAVVHQLASGDPVSAVGRAIAAGVFGAAQLAVAIATPIPKYAAGRKGGKAEWALTGEAGTERIDRPDGTSYLVDRPTITFLEQDAKVIPNHELRKESVRNSIMSGMYVTGDGNLYDNIDIKAALQEQTSQLIRAYASNRSTIQIINDWKGSEVKFQKMTGYVKWINDNITT
jgi:hypothetical protein